MSLSVMPTQSRLRCSWGSGLVPSSTSVSYDRHESAASAAIDAARARGVEHHVGLFDAVLTLGALSLEAGQLNEAERLIEEALRRSERIRPPFELLGLIERARLFRARGELVEGLGILERARTVLPAGSRSPLIQRADVLEARLRIDLGEPARAAELARTLPRSPTRCLLEARSLLALGQADRADVTMNELEASALGVPRTIELTALRADVRRTWGSATTTISGDSSSSGVRRASSSRCWTGHLAFVTIWLPS